jgi:hypothetical protein
MAARVATEHMAVTVATVVAQRSRIWRRRLGLGSLAEEEKGRGSGRGQVCERCLEKLGSIVGVRRFHGRRA